MNRAPAPRLMGMRLFKQTADHHRTDVDTRTVTTRACTALYKAVTVELKASQQTDAA